MRSFSRNVEGKYGKERRTRSIRSSAAEYLTFVASTGDSDASVEMRYEDKNIWLTQKMMAVLYDVDVRTVNYHIKKIFKGSELQEDSVIRKIRITATDGKSYSTNHYSLQMIMIRMPRQQSVFMQRYRIRCIMQSMDILRQN